MRRPSEESEGRVRARPSSPAQRKSRGGASWILNRWPFFIRSLLGPIALVSLFFGQRAPLVRLRCRLRHLRDRPVTMERFPDGIDGPRLVQKRAAAYFPRWIHTASMPKQDGTVRHVVCQDGATLVYLANQACITPHVWLSRTDKPHQPDQMIFDLDPSGDDFRTVCRAAISLRELLRKEHLDAFVKT